MLSSTVLIREHSQFYCTLKEEFSAFCEVAQKCLVDPEQFPGVEFIVDKSGDRAVLNALGESFVFRIRVADEQCVCGLLSVYLRTENDWDFLLGAHFDYLGNFRIDPEVNSSSCTISDSQFFKIITNELVRKLLERSAVPPFQG